MRYPISKNINEKSQHLISWLDYYSISKYNIRQLLPMDIALDLSFSMVCLVMRRQNLTLVEESQYLGPISEHLQGLGMSWKVSYANDNDMNLYNSSY